jgi:hypothetical protein
VWRLGHSAPAVSEATARQLITTNPTLTGVCLRLISHMSVPTATAATRKPIALSFTEDLPCDQIEVLLSAARIFNQMIAPDCFCPVKCHRKLALATSILTPRRISTDRLEDTLKIRRRRREYSFSSRQIRIVGAARGIVRDLLEEASLILSPNPIE